jgi:dTDP-4-amino-4,6-dideoxygalactose transaminase
MTPMNKPVPFNRASVVGNEMEYVAAAVRDSRLAGDGAFTRRCSTLLEEALGVPRVLLTTSCTHALEMSALLLDIRPGDEVIIPAFTFVSTVNAFVLRGASPVFIDVHRTTLNLDESQIERLITSRTKAIVPVHYAGVGCAMERITALAARSGIAVVEDNAHGLFGKYAGKYLGTFGCLATQSFHETKNFVCGEGGALLLNDPAYIERAEIIREKGTDRSRFFRGQVDKYTWVDIGSSYLPSELLAAFLLGQLEQRDRVQAKRRKIWEYYNSLISPWAEEAGIRLPVIPEVCDHPYHMYYILTPSLEKRHALIAHFKSRGISAVFHYLPLHLSGMGRRLGGKPGDCPVTEDISERLLRLPFYYELKEEEQDLVIQALREFFL